MFVEISGIRGPLELGPNILRHVFCDRSGGGLKAVSSLLGLGVGSGGGLSIGGVTNSGACLEVAVFLPYMALYK